MEGLVNTVVVVDRGVAIVKPALRSVHVAPEHRVRGRRRRRCREGNARDSDGAHSFLVLCKVRQTAGRIHSIIRLRDYVRTGRALITSTCT